MRVNWFLLGSLLLSCGARSGVELLPPEEAARLDASRPDAGVPIDAPARVDTPAPVPCTGPGTWVEWESPTDADLSDVIVAGDEAWVVGAYGIVLRGDGARWREDDSAGVRDLYSIWVDGRGAGAITTEHGFYRRVAGSWRWEYFSALPEFAVLSAVWGRGRDDIWFGGGSVSPAVGLHAHWDGTAITLVEGEPTGIQVLQMRGSEDGRAIWAVSQLGRVSRTIDGGAWQSVPEPEGETATAVWAPTADEAWLAALYGEVHHWEGGRWERFDVSTDDVYYYAVWGSSSSDVWVAGYEGAAAHFDGAGWSEVTLPTAQTITAIDGTCATDAWMVGGGGTILRLVAAP